MALKAQTFLAVLAISVVLSSHASHSQPTPSLKIDRSMSEMQDVHKFPTIFGRLATKDDFEKGTAVFYQDPAGTIYKKLPLPSIAEIKDENGKVDKVIIVQTEGQANYNDVIVGYRTFDGGKGVALLSEFTLPR